MKTKLTEEQEKREYIVFHKQDQQYLHTLCLVINCLYWLGQNPLPVLRKAFPRHTFQLRTTEQLCKQLWCVNPAKLSVAITNQDTKAIAQLVNMELAKHLMWFVADAADGLVFCD